MSTLLNKEEIEKKTISNKAEELSWEEKNALNNINYRLKQLKKTFSETGENELLSKFEQFTEITDKKQIKELAELLLQEKNLLLEDKNTYIFQQIEWLADDVRNYFDQINKKQQKEEWLKKDDNLVLDREKQFDYVFQINKLLTFEVTYHYLGANKNPYFSTQANMFTRNKKDYSRGGQAQGILPRKSKAYEFYKKWDCLHLAVLNETSFQEMMKDIEELKKQYNFLERKGLEVKDYGFHFSDVVELSKETPKTKNITPNMDDFKYCIDVALTELKETKEQLSAKRTI